MPEHLRALPVILALAAVVFALAKAPACAIATTSRDFERRRNLWVGLTLAAFLAHNFWIYIIVAAALLLAGSRREPNTLAMFFFLLFALPLISAEVPGFGVVNFLFEIDYGRLLALTVLLPAYLSLRKQPGIEPFGRPLPDKFIAGYMLLTVLLMLTYSPFTSTLRHGVFYSFIDIFLPYYVASRYLKDLPGFRDALMAFAVAAMVLSAIGAFESVWQWLLYSSLDRALGVRWGGGVPLMRGENLRAAGTAGQAIPMGYVIAVAIGLFLYLRRSVPSPLLWGLGLTLLIVGEVAPLSRGPWVGAAAMVLVFVATGPSPGVRLAKLGLFGVLALPLLLATPAGNAIIDHLPFIGTIEETNVNYRKLLLEISFQVIQDNLLFGSTNWSQSAAMQELVQGQGMIDLVNSYVGVALSSGLVGLSLFAGFFIAVEIGIYKAMRKAADKNAEPYVLGQALFATLLGILIIIFTVSSIHFIPVVYWSVAGLGVAYARMVAPAKAPAVKSSAGFRPASAKRKG